MLFDPMVADLLCQRIEKCDRPADAAHLADREKVFSPGLEVAVTCAEEIVQLAATELLWALGQIIEVVLVKPHAVELPAHAPHEFCKSRIAFYLAALARLRGQFDQRISVLDVALVQAKVRL